MAGLSKSFNLETRGQIANLAHGIADMIAPALAEHLKTGSQNALVIGLTGGADAGKSIFWDEIVRKLSHGRAIYIHRESDSNEVYGRLREKWLATGTNHEPLFNILCANVNAMDTGPDDEAAFAARTAASLGDVILYSNPYPGFLPAERYAATISLDHREDPQARQWDRSVQVDVPASSPLTRFPVTRHMLG
jgi:hypothetical protein